MQKPFYKYLIFLTFLFYHPFQTFAADGSFSFLSCEGRLVKPSIEVTTNEWIPSSDDLSALSTFKLAVGSNAVLKPGLLSAMIETSPLFRKAMSMVLFQLGTVYLEENASSYVISSWITAAILNPVGKARIGFLRALDTFIVDLIEANADFTDSRSGEEEEAWRILIPQLGGWAEKKLSEEWFGERVSNPVYSWIDSGKPANSSAENKNSSLIIMPDMNFLNTIVRVHLEEPLLPFAQMVPDQLFFYFQKKGAEYQKLLSHYHRMWGLAKKDGLFKPYDHKEVSVISELSPNSHEKKIRAKAVIDELLASAEFFKAFSDFADCYSDFVNDLVVKLDTGAFGQSEEEYLFLRRFLQEKLFVFPMELAHMGVDLKTNSRRYKMYSNKILNSIAQLKTKLQM